MPISFSSARFVCLRDRKRGQQNGVIFIHFSEVNSITKERDEDLCWHKGRSLGQWLGAMMQ